MCGIAGYVGRHPLDEKRIALALERMRQRGPDHRDSAVFAEPERHVALLHARLSIIDLSDEANQPFSVDGCSLVFNGEIYNYREVRERLEARGVGFRTRSDTEVLLRAYLEYGTECVDQLEGMWAFAIYDPARRRLFLSRDRFAEKPLYTLERPEGFYFASEIKSLKALCGDDLRVERAQILRYLVNGYKSLYKTEDTFFEGVRELPFGSNLTLDAEAPPRAWSYWRPRFETRSMDTAEAVERVREALIESVRLRLTADVPIAFCLSGGVDSASLASIAAKVHGYRVHTFSILDDDERYDESANIQATIDDLGCPHTLIRVPYENGLERLAELIRYHDAPLATISYYIHSYLSQAISEHGYRVAVSGTAADELLTGYYDHFNLQLYELRGSPEYAQRLADWREHIGGLVRNPHLQKPDLYFENPGFRDHIYLNSDVFAGLLRQPYHEPFVETTYCDSLLRNRMLNELLHEGTRVILHEDDLNSMCYSVENRSPYLDSRLFQEAYAVPSALLIQHGYGKYILREAVAGILNEQVRTDRHKKGFNANFRGVFDLDDAETVGSFLAESPVWELVDRDKARGLLGMDPMPNSYSKFLFNLLNVKIFLEQHAPA